VLALPSVACVLGAAEIGAVDGESDAGESESSEGDALDDGESTDAEDALDDSTGDPDDRGRDGGSVSQLHSAIVDCDVDGGYEVDVVRAPWTAERLWVAGVYQTRDDHSYGYHPVGDGTVLWGIPGDNVLVLSSYEPTRWIVELVEGGALSRILVFGYHGQLVDAPSSVPVEVYAYEDGTGEVACGYWLSPGFVSGSDCDADELVALAEAWTDRRLTGFDGCYDARQLRYLEGPIPVP
jgi:hypothetical protein